jgi:TolB-like protein/Tfp pilus assembly protein PilF
MVAVLPFVSSSMEGDSDFFATGVHDDLLTQLAKLESMRVISRTSVLEYKNTTRNLRQIGAELGADIILEGGVQIAGERIRINAQLIDTHTDEHMWAETYDRGLSPVNIFDVQREIAQAIATALNTTLTVQDSQLLTVIPTENMAAYRAFRRAMEIRNSDGISNLEYIPLLEDAVELDPNFSRAWAELAGALALQAAGAVTPSTELAREVEQTLEHIRTIAPGSAEYLIAQAFYIYYILRDYDQAYAVASQALARNPSDIEVLELMTWIERRQGNLDARNESLRTLVKLDPRNKGRTNSLITNLWVAHRYDETRLEVENTSNPSNHVLAVGELMELREDGDFERWLKSTRAIYPEAEEPANDPFLWLAYLANRDYSVPAQWSAAVDLEERAQFTSVPWRVSNGIMVYWLMGEETKLEEFVSYARVHLERSMDGNGEFDRISPYLDMALVLGAEGDADESLRYVRRWDLLVSTDLAEQTHAGAVSCWILGMIRATGAAVKCIGTQLKQPSYVMPFLNPFLPFFDLIRDEPEFVELMEEINSELDQYRNRNN